MTFSQSLWVGLGVSALVIIIPVMVSIIVEEWGPDPIKCETQVQNYGVFGLVDERGDSKNGEGFDVIPPGGGRADSVHNFDHWQYAQYYIAGRVEQCMEIKQQKK